MTISNTRPPLTFDEAMAVSTTVFGEIGRDTMLLWQQYNRAFFGGVLTPVPVLYVPTSTYGHWVGQCGAGGERIYLMRISDKRPWAFVRAVLLHEMIHQACAEKEVNLSHDRQPWCDEIMRISREHFGVAFWAGYYTVAKVGSGAGRHSVRTNKTGPNGEASLPMKDIAR
jgi:hypothetical protein